MTTQEKLRQLLGYMKQNNASDLHITVGIPPYIRIDGRIMPTQFPPMGQEECESMIFSVLTEEQIAKFKEEKVLDCSYGEKSLGRFRMNIYSQRGTIAIAIRRLHETIMKLEELGLPLKAAEYLCNLPQGLVIIAGPVGSGKTTTLASMVEYINQGKGCHIISIEEPIEYLHSSRKSLIHQREINTDAPSFAEALKQGLREDPDVVVIGEMRDLETISSAVTIAETGHLVLATLHTSDAGESISRIVDVFPAEQQAQVRVQLASTLEGVIIQTLLPSINGAGRVLAAEVMFATSAIKSLIRENKIDKIYSHIQIGGQFGMQTMNQSLYQLVQKKKLQRDVALAVSPRPKELHKLFGEVNYA
ncbi:MAG: type IV pilus twitching motility protein PilT [Elusimicrobia bacterium]|nr:type IV pilus twitching motility protein PilT [Elusimicrobiota bacterium]